LFLSADLSLAVQAAGFGVATCPIAGCSRVEGWFSVSMPEQRVVVEFCVREKLDAVGACVARVDGIWKRNNFTAVFWETF